ncbi:hypothetical protein [Bacillus sp. MRMR6]|uniref:hypothetical protein n=1 Tax=Bacillus sp. MRMR6 TaxID=1928617 RepID=UPI000950D91F|nr:hypothetical protein [Bacillus sp. MRMR6]OLS36773.1 hypothetical protein BTR25_17310 [Bacillus sp. MRMR6]
MLDKKLLLELKEYVKCHLTLIVFNLSESMASQEKSIAQHFELEEFIKSKRQPTFNKVLFSYIDKLGSNDSDIYKKAGLDRRLFSKIRSNPGYRPGKTTVVALGLALELEELEFDNLLSSAGYSLSDSETFDLVIQFCLEKGIYNLYQVNEALDYFSLKPLNGVNE